MSFAEELQSTAEWSPETLSTFQRDIPADWIEEALKKTGTVSLRRRRLPAEQVVWLVLGIALYRDRSIGDVCDKLDLALPEADKPFVATSALAQARARLGEEPLRSEAPSIAQ
ncbi:MAG: transposase domain-containing protein [Pseudomonadota bacterium]